MFLLLLFYPLQDAVNYTSKCLSQRLFFPSNSLIWGCSSSTYLFLLLLFYPLQDAVNYTSKCLSQRLFFPSNSLIHFFLIHVLLTGTRSLLGQFFKIYQPECMLSISVFPIFFFFQNNCSCFTSFASSSGYILGVRSICCQWRHSCVSVYLYNIQLNTGMESGGISWSKEFALLHR